MSSSTSAMGGLVGTASPLPSVAGSELSENTINLQIFVPELQIQVRSSFVKIKLLLLPVVKLVMCNTIWIVLLQHFHYFLYKNM